MTERPVTVLKGPVDFSIRPPGSKSETIRALTVAALADDRSHLYSPLRADDPEAMVGALRALGVDVGDRDEPWYVDGRDGRLTAPGGALDARESGLTARILLALAGSLDGVTVVTGRGRLPDRPMGGIVDVLRRQGVEVKGDRLPIEVTGRGRLWGGPIEVDCSESSQFASAVMLVAPIMHEPCRIELRGLVGSAGYLDVTASIMERFGARVERTVTGYEIANDGYTSADVLVEADASAAVYPMGIAAITGGRARVEGLGEHSSQPDLRMAGILEGMGARVTWDAAGITVDAGDTDLAPVDVDMSDAPDGALALAVVCLFAGGTSRIRGLGSLRHKESNRLDAVSTEIVRIGGIAVVEGDTLLVTPGELRGGVVDPHGDHRIAMAMAMAGTRVPDLSVANPSVVDKTWPGFWEFLDHLAA